MRCFVCREDNKPSYRSWILLWYLMPIPLKIRGTDEVTGEKFVLCNDCARKIKSRPHGIPAVFNITIPPRINPRLVVENFFKHGLLCADEVERIYYDYAEDKATRLLGSKPMWVLPLSNDGRCVAVDEPAQRILLDNKVVAFSDIDSYKIFDKSIEYHIQSPNSTQNNVSTNNGLRRTIVGGLFAGSAGTVMGGLTANHSMEVNESMKSTYNTTEHDFDVLVLLKSFNYGGSVAVKIGNDGVKMQIVVNLIEKIMR